MSIFGGSSNTNLEQTKDQLRMEFAKANAQELISKLNDKCFEKCIPQPGSSFSSSEQTCVNKCMERYMEAWNLVSQVYMDKVQQVTNNQH